MLLINMKIFNKKESGFTLIELLVVITIIGLLASVILVSLEDARTKGKNSAKNQLVEEYIKALELYRSSHPEEGYPNLNTPLTYYCLGESSEPKCFLNFYDYNSDLNDKIKEFIAGPPADKISTPFGSGDVKGVIYNCSENAPCSKYKIKWYLIGNDEKCIKGIVGNNPMSNITTCVFDSEDNLEIN